MLGTWKGAKPRIIPSVPAAPFPSLLSEAGISHHALRFLFSILGWKVSEYPYFLWTDSWLRHRFSWLPCFPSLGG